jgi:predicted ATP-grasp superfamily ATP-dependent carboligase
MRQQSHGADIDTTVPAVVLRSQRAGFPQHGVLGVVRTLGRLGVHVVLASPTAGGIAGSSRYVAGWESWEPHDADDPGALVGLRRVGETHEGAILLPTDDLSAVLVDAHAEALRDVFRLPSIAAGVLPGLVDKLSLAERCEHAGGRAPATAAVSDLDEAEAFVARVAMPVVVKADLATLVAGVGRSVTIATSREEVFDAVRAADGRRILLQEHIPGDPRRVNWMFDGYLDAGSVCRFGATGRKTGQYPAYSGMATSAVSERNDEVARVALALLQDVGYVGPVDVDLRHDERDGRYKIVDVNPRVGGTFRLFVAPNGMDVVRAAYLDLTGQGVPASSVPDGRSWLVETHVAASGVAYRRDGWITAGAWIRSLAGVDEGALFSLDDPRPMLGATGHAAARAIGRLGRPTRG